jgi:uncharacterized metal-binding protein YceD (DUF177 family)
MSQRTKQPAKPMPETAPKRPSPKLPWSFPVAVADIPETGLRVDFTADRRTREAVAALAGVIDVSRLEAGFDLTRQGRDGLHASGRVTASVVQNCVVTLEPIENEIDETINLSFTPPSGAPTTKGAAAYHAMDAEDPPEALKDGSVDLGAVATEFLLLGIDPYPRKEGATFDAPAFSDPAGHPFATLQALKKGTTIKDR